MCNAVIGHLNFNGNLSGCCVELGKTREECVHRFGVSLTNEYDRSVVVKESLFRCSTFSLLTCHYVTQIN